MKKNFVKIVALILAVLMALSVLFAAIPYILAAESSASIRQTINSLEAEANEIASKKNALQKEIDANKSKTKTTVEKKAQIDQQIEISRLEIQNINDQIQQYNLLIAQKQEELDEGLALQAQLNSDYKLRIRAMEESGTVSYWSILFKASSFSDLLDRLNMIREISTSDQMMLKQMQENNDRIAAARSDMESDRELLSAKNAELNTLNSELAAQRQEAEAVILELSEELNTLSERREELDKADDKLRAEIMDAEKKYEAALTAEQQATLAQQNVNNPAGGQGGTSFISPLPLGSCTVTDSYGYRIHPIYGYYGMHGGVDLAAPTGTPVYAIAAGTVTRKGKTEANGNYIGLTHGNGWGSLYLHLDSFAVNDGATVSQGQIIGYVGSTGWATGPHLHFEIHYNGATVNPMDYIKIR